jgi:Sulfotransferase family
MFGRRKQNPRAAEGERVLEPILVDYFTRDGSTLMMRLLATSPEIAVGGQYPYEHKYFAYLYRWARLLERREWPRDFWSGAHLASLVQEDHMPFLGPPPWIPRDLLEPGQGGEGISDYSFRTVWAEFSRRAVAHTREQRKAPGGEARYYAEKHLDSWKVKLDDLPSVRLLALLRDPRDTYISIMAFRRKRREAGQRGFAMGRGPAESDDSWLARYLYRQKERLRWIDLVLQEGTMPVFRYEDLVLDLPGQARKLADWLGVKLDPAAVVGDDRLSVHVSADTPELSIGRWRSEMPPELAKRFNDELGVELKALGFEIPGPQPSRRRPVEDPAEVIRPKARTAADAGDESREQLRGALGGVEGAQQEPGEALTTANLDRARLGAALEAAAMEKARLKRELRETERWLRSLECSRSWRITRPIRAAGAAFRRLSQWRPASPRRGV